MFIPKILNVNICIYNYSHYFIFVPLVINIFWRITFCYHILMYSLAYFYYWLYRVESAECFLTTTYISLSFNTGNELLCCINVCVPYRAK